MLKYCQRCLTDKPAEGFVRRSRGKTGRTKINTCAHCAAKKIPKSVAERDAFGRSVTEGNGTNKSLWKSKAPLFEWKD